MTKGAGTVNTQSSGNKRNHKSFSTNSYNRTVVHHHHTSVHMSPLEAAQLASLTQAMRSVLDVISEERSRGTTPKPNDSSKAAVDTSVGDEDSVVSESSSSSSSVRLSFTSENEDDANPASEMPDAECVKPTVLTSRSPLSSDSNANAPNHRQALSDYQENLMSRRPHVRGVDINLLSIKSPLFLPLDTPEYIQQYMRSDFWFSPFVIPLWKTCPHYNLGTGRNIETGDVGVLDSQGGFKTEFNIFLTKEENAGLGFHTPPDFQPLDPGVVPQSEGVLPGWHQTSKQDAVVRKTGPSELVFTSKPDKERRHKFSAICLPHGAECQNVVLGDLGMPIMREYAKDCAISWYNHLHSKLRVHDTHSKTPIPLSCKSLILVTATYTAPSWAAATISPVFRSKGRKKIKLGQLPASEYVPVWDQVSEFFTSSGPGLDDLDETGKPPDAGYCVGISGVEMQYDARFYCRDGPFHSTPSPPDESDDDSEIANSFMSGVRNFLAASIW
ncbi:hypothetical protein NLJ89_g2237 [Agrocybe chaxingu]|uniref:Uncharacterized protein n=1 Tax=Agrocybe chaxingu TaxID=84603 RepID=A0A9W8KCH2_9AGAR|nr:hypothetical protein NLJ89_g2237 [Agrocybe chaxingu]